MNCEYSSSRHLHSGSSHQRDITFCDLAHPDQQHLYHVHRLPAIHVASRSTSAMTSYPSFEELEASVPLTQLRPSVAFSRCASHLPDDVDQLHGDELVVSLERALTIHSKARVVLQSWVLLIMRRRVSATHEKALYGRLQQTALGPQEKIRYRRGAMLLCHLLVDREAAQADSLLDRYLTEFYFPWSSAVNVRDDTFYLHANVVDWVRQAWDFRQQNGSNMTAVRWLELTAPSPPVSDAQVQTQSTTTIEAAPPTVLRTRIQDSSRSRGLAPHSPSPQPCSRPSITHKKRRRNGSVRAHRELEALKEAVEQWATRLRRQLLRAALCNDSVRIRQIADELQAPPLVCRAGGSAAGDSTDEGESGHDGGEAPRRRRVSGETTTTTATTDSDDDSSGDGLSQPEQPEDVNECAVCVAEPKRVEQVWNASCGHGFCGECMLARLSQRQRQRMYCRAKLLQLVDGSGNVYQHYEWTRWWREQRLVD
jgi:hypothetical protein